MMRTILALAALLAAGPALAADLTPEAVKQQVEKAYPVQVLRVDPAEQEGKRIYSVRVMDKSGAGNGGFTVTTLIVDAASGRLLPVFRHGVSGYSVPDAIYGDPRQVNVPYKGSTWR
jgi:hypothetical protein